MWLSLMADRIARAYKQTPVGHAARLNGLKLKECRQLCTLLRPLMGADWDVVVVNSEPTDPEEVRLDAAIERRNDKSRSRLFIVPIELVSEAAASLADTEPKDVAEHLRGIYLTLLRT